jgi:hypothetical protein
LSASPLTAATIRSAARGATESGEPSRAQSAPAAKSSESPGRNGVTTRPVSQKTIRNSTT